MSEVDVKRGDRKPLFEVVYERVRDSIEDWWEADGREYVTHFAEEVDGNIMDWSGSTYMDRYSMFAIILLLGMLTGVVFTHSVPAATIVLGITAWILTATGFNHWKRGYDEQ